MGIVSVAEKRTGRSRKQGSDWKRTYTRTFLVITDDSQNDGVVIASARDPATGLVIPGIGAAYKVGDKAAPLTILTHDTGAFVTSTTATCATEDGLQWEVEVEYGPYDASIWPQNPLDHPVKVSWNFAKFEQVAFRDINGKAIVNSAGDYFDPPVTIDDSRPIVKIVRNEATFDPVLAKTYKDSTNTDTFLGQDPYTWKISDIQGDLEYNMDCGTPDGFYYVVTYELEFNPDTWKKLILDQGMRGLDGSGKFTQFLDDKGQPVSDPVLMDGNGGRKSATADPHFFTFEVYREVAFADLNLDFSGAPGQGG